MRRLLCAAFFLATTIGLAHAANFAVRGVVVDARTGRPIPQAVVRLQLQADPTSDNGRNGPGGRGGNFIQQFALGAGPGGDAPAGGAPAGGGPQILGGRRSANRQNEDLTAIADAAGRFQLTPTLAGRWVLSASGRGYRLQRYQQHENSSTEVVLGPATPAVELRFPLREDARVTGILTDEAGEPVRGASVTLFERIPRTLEDASTITRRGATTSDDRGAYEFEQLAPGDYLVAVSATPWYVQAIAQSGARGAQNNQNPQQQATTAAVQTAIATQTSATTPPQRDPRFDVAYPTLYSGGATDVTRATISHVTAGEHLEVNLHLTPVQSLHLQLTATTGVTNNGPGGRGGPQVPAVVPLGPDGQPLPYRPQIVAGSNGTELTGLTPGDYRVVTQIPTPATDGSGGGGRGGQRGGQQRQSVTTVIHIANGISLDRSLGALGLVHVTMTLPSVDHAPAVNLTGEDTHVTYSARPEGGNPPGGFGRRGNGGPAPASPSTATTAAETPTLTTPKPEPSITLSVQVPPGRYRIELQDRRKDGIWLEGIDGAPAVGPVVTVQSDTRLTLTTGQGRALLMGTTVAGTSVAPGALVELVPAKLGAPTNLAAIRRAQAGTDMASLTPKLVKGVPLLLKANDTSKPKVPAQ